MVKTAVPPSLTNWFLTYIFGFFFFLICFYCWKSWSFLENGHITRTLPSSLKKESENGSTLHLDPLKRLLLRKWESISEYAHVPVIAKWSMCLQEAKRESHRWFQDHMSAMQRNRVQRFEKEISPQEVRWQQILSSWHLGSWWSAIYYLLLRWT
jgi:hypothetical protein